MQDGLFSYVLWIMNHDIMRVAMTIYTVSDTLLFLSPKLLVNFPLVRQLSLYITLLLEEIIDGNHWWNLHLFFLKHVYETAGDTRTFYVWTLQDQYRRGVSYNQIFFCLCEPEANRTRSLFLNNRFSFTISERHVLWNFRSCMVLYSY